MDTHTTTQFLLSLLMFAPGVFLLAGALFGGLFLVVERVMHSAHAETAAQLAVQATANPGPIVAALNASLAAQTAVRTGRARVAP